MEIKPGVVVINYNEDIANLLEAGLSNEGLRVKGALLSLVAEDTQVFLDVLGVDDLVLLDIPHPYREWWMFAKKLQALPEAAGHGFIFTTTNRDLLERVLTWEERNETTLVQQPFDLQNLAEIIKDSYRKTLEKRHSSEQIDHHSL